jgi:WD40 repeat protein
VKLFDRNNFEKVFFTLKKAFCSIHDISKDISSVDFSNKGSQFCTAGGDGIVRIFNMNITA